MVRFGRSCPDGFLPAFSVDSEEEALQLLTLACPLDQAGNFVARELAQTQTINNLVAFSHRLAEAYYRLKGTADATKKRVRSRR